MSRFRDRCAPYTAYITEAVVSFRESHPIVYFLTFSLSSLITIYTFPQAEGKKRYRKCTVFFSPDLGIGLGIFRIAITSEYLMQSGAGVSSGKFLHVPIKLFNK